MTTKYIVDNLTGQTITGDLSIVGNFNVNGVNSESLVTYKALLSQTSPISGTDINAFDLSFIIGETYTITNYVSGDDFSNVANVQTGTINETGCVFTATGGVPTTWTNGSQIDSSGILVVDVLENTLGYDLVWVQTPFGGTGYYVAFNYVVGPSISNLFPRNNVSITTQVKEPLNWGFYPYIDIFSNTVSVGSLDDSLVVWVYDYDAGTEVNNALYYTPIEINIKQDMSPILVEGVINSSYPISNTSVNITCDGSFVANFYGDPTSNNISELVYNLNSDPNTSYLGTYVQNGEAGVSLNMYSYLKERYCPSGTITFEVFAD